MKQPGHSRGRGQDKLGRGAGRSKRGVKEVFVAISRSMGL